MFIEDLQGWGLHHFPGQPVPMPDQSEGLQENRAASCRRGGFVPRVAWLH